LVVGGNGTRKQGEELRRGAPKHVHAEHGAAGPGRRSHDAGIDREDLSGRRNRRKPKRLDRGELARPGHGCRLAGGGGAEIDVEQIRRVPARLEPRPDLLPRRSEEHLNSSHLGISYAVFCLKKKKINTLTLYL